MMIGKMHSAPALCIVIAVAATLALPCRGQESRATVVGRVTDASAAVVPIATVKITNEATGVTVTSQTNETGNSPLQRPRAGDQ